MVARIIQWVTIDSSLHTNSNPFVISILPYSYFARFSLGQSWAINILKKSVCHFLQTFVISWLEDTIFITSVYIKLMNCGIAVITLRSLVYASSDAFVSSGFSLLVLIKRDHLTIKPSKVCCKTEQENL